MEYLTRDAIFDAYNRYNIMIEDMRQDNQNDLLKMHEKKYTYLDYSDHSKSDLITIPIFEIIKNIQLSI